MDAIVSKLKSKNLKITPQRLAIYNFLYNTTAHPSAENIFKSVEKQYPSMSLATVYKTLDTLKKSLLISEINVGEDSYRYDANTEPHPHIICEECKEVADIKNVKTTEALRKEISESTDYVVLREQLYFYGLCPTCQATD